MKLGQFCLWEQLLIHWNNLNGTFVNINRYNKHIMVKKTMNSRKPLGIITLFSLILVLTTVSGCLDSTIDALRENGDDTVIGPIDSNVPTANTEFGFNLFNEIWESEQNQNIFISPFSVSVALAMTLNGASGETEQAMTDTLQLHNLSSDTINSSFYQLQNTLQTSDPKVTLTIANSLWGREGFQFKTDFLQRNELYFRADTSILDFLNPSTLQTINQWVNDNTDSKIPKILDEIEPNAVLFLINAIYFKGSWQTEFDPSDTSDGQFHLVDGSTKQVPMMYRTGPYPVYNGEDFQAINIPYGEGRMGMYIFLPDANKSDLNGFIESVNTAKWENWMEEFREREVQIKIPKFKLEYGTKVLNDVLTSLGMGVAFDEDNADFSRMADLDAVGGNLYITKVAHRTFIEVNEEGTEAAAATSVGIGIKSVTPRFIVDRPFFFAIRDNETGTVLFMGTVVEP